MGELDNSSSLSLAGKNGIKDFKLNVNGSVNVKLTDYGIGIFSKVNTGSTPKLDSEGYCQL